ncbi:hypothetical protein GGI02_004802 [Coemansia sp. RSA 2322]|uniref:WDR90 4th beta-propeller domain-containing protein n=1 Tax=Coemansia thaxteri TaxID=2663907 RepID=A0A9W8EDL8_9FUNG|nr:hypothetical protein H4R26_004447 [Coemansia thaxteri]KAJ2465094.1 hypothetical protein GGI02_004802 [Coemansia sp. RSA 2322]
MVLKSEDVNYLVYRYLKESGFLHSSYIFQFESQIHKNDNEIPSVEPGSLIRVLQKGLQYMDVETHLNEDGTARLCTAPFSLVGKHVCTLVADSAGGVAAAAPNGRGSSVAAVRQNDASPSRQQQQQQRPDELAAAATAAAHGGHTLVHDTGATAKEGPKKVAKTRDTTSNAQSPAVAAPAAAVAVASAVVAAAAVDDDDESMDVDVPDTERDSQQRTVSETGSRPAVAPASAVAGGRKTRQIERAQILRGHTSPVFMCAWNPTAGNVVATGSGDGTARIWDVSRAKSDAEYSVVLKHDALEGEARVDVTAIVWNAQGTMLATACFSGQLRVWTAAGEPKLTLKQTRQVPIIAVRWNHKGTLLLSACLDGSIALWDMQAGVLRHEYKGHTGSVLDVDWLDNSTFASCAADKSVVVWRDGSLAPVKTFTGHRSDVNTIKWHPGGKYLASASDDGSVKVWSMASDTPVQDFFGHAQQVYTVKWLPRPDKAIVASASFDGTVRVWDVQSGACLRVLSAHAEAVHCLAFSSDGRYLASGSFDKNVRIWSIKDGTLFKTYTADDGIHDVQWAAKGRVAVAIDNCQVALFDPLNG